MSVQRQTMRWLLLYTLLRARKEGVDVEEIMTSLS